MRKSRLLGRPENPRWHADSGYSVVLNRTSGGPEYSYSTYPDAWHKLYAQKHLLYVDPVIKSLLGSEMGTTRWSDIAWLDPMGVLSSASKYGLNYGAAVWTNKNGCISLLTAARSDREFTAGELLQLESVFRRLVKLAESGSTQSQINDASKKGAER